MMIEDRPQSGTSDRIPSKSNDLFLLLLAWVGMLIIWSLPDILFQYLSGQVPPWLDHAKLAGSALYLGVVLVWTRIRLLWQYGLVLLVFFLAYVATQWIFRTPWWQSRFGGEDVSFFVGYSGIFILDFVIALAVLVVLWEIKKNRQDFFLTRGQLDEPIKPVRGLGIREGYRLAPAQTPTGRNVHRINEFNQSPGAIIHPACQHWIRSFQPNFMCHPAAQASSRGRTFFNSWSRD